MRESRVKLKVESTINPQIAHSVVSGFVQIHSNSGLEHFLEIITRIYES